MKTPAQAGVFIWCHMIWCHMIWCQMNGAPTFVLIDVDRAVIFSQFLLRTKALPSDPNLET